MATTFEACVVAILESSLEGLDQGCDPTVAKEVAFDNLIECAESYGLIDHES